MNSPYSTSKAFYHHDRIAELKNGNQPYPVHVECILSDFCDMNCSFCSYRMDGYTSNQLFQIEPGQTRKARNPKRMMPTEKALEIIDDCVKMGVKAWQATGGGEPTLHPDFVKIASYAQEKGIDTSLVTNGSMLYKKEVRDVILNMKWIRISIDASNIDTYCRVREVGKNVWDRVIAGIKILAEERNKLGADLVIGIGFVATPETWMEMLDATNLYKSLGVDNVRLGLMFNPEDAKPYQKNRKEMEELSIECEKISNESFKVINRVPEKLDELEKKNPDYSFCGYQNFTTYIGGDLNVYRCCVYAYNERGVVGSLKTQTFKELWDGEQKKKNFSCFDAKGCERCQFNQINREIIDHVSGKSDPLHVNFV